MIRRRITPLILLMLWAGTQALNTKAEEIQLSPAETVKQANLEYSQAYFDHALELYLSVVEQGYASADLLYNIGNTYYKLNRIPEAILYYERALKLSPRDENTLFNLELARTRIVDKIEPLPELFYVSWFRSLFNLFSADGWARFGIITLFIAFGMAALYLLATRRWLKVLGFYAAVVFLFFAVSGLGMAWGRHNQLTNANEAIVFTPSVTVKSSPSDNSIDLFVIHEGTKVSITGNMGEWLEIRIPSGSMGWLKADAIERI